MRKILITGGAGFVGANLVRYLLQHTDAELCILDALEYAGNRLSLPHVNEIRPYEFIQGRIEDETLLSQLLARQFDVVINLAAQTHVDRSITAPLNFLKTNTHDTVVFFTALLEAWRKNARLRFIHFSTDEVYGSVTEDVIFTETSRYQPSSPYSASKAAADHWLEAYATTYGFPALIVHPSNLYGPFQFPEKLIPLVLAKCMQGETIPLYGDGSNKRQWLFVDDLCAAIHKVILKEQSHETLCHFNFPGQSVSTNRDLVLLLLKILIEQFNFSESLYGLIRTVVDRPGHDLHYEMNGEKVAHLIDWNPETSLHAGLVKTVQWYLQHEDWLRGIKATSYNGERLGTL